MLFETVLQPGSTKTISNIFVRNHVTFFKIDGESFCTAAGGIHHSSSPMFDGPLMHVFAGEAHDPAKKLEYQREIDKQEYEHQLWEKHKVQAIKEIIATAQQAGSDEMMVCFLETVLNIEPEEPAIIMVKRMEDEQNTPG